MNPKLVHALYWAPRAASIVFIAFISLFALDVFGGADPWWMQLLGFLVHLLPTFVLVIGLVIAWRWEWVGAAAYIGFGLLYLIFFNDQHWSALILVGALPALIGLLWLIGWVKREEISAIRSVK